MMRAPKDPPHWDELTAQGKERPDPEVMAQLGKPLAGASQGRECRGACERVWKASTHQGRAMVSED